MIRKVRKCDPNTSNCPNFTFSPKSLILQISFLEISSPIPLNLHAQRHLFSHSLSLSVPFTFSSLPHLSRRRKPLQKHHSQEKHTDIHGILLIRITLESSSDHDFAVTHRLRSPQYLSFIEVLYVESPNKKHKKHTKNLQSLGKQKFTVKCKYCGEPGHNRLGCAKRKEAEGSVSKTSKVDVVCTFCLDVTMSMIVH